MLAGVGESLRAAATSSWTYLTRRLGVFGQNAHTVAFGKAARGRLDTGVPGFPQSDGTAAFPRSRGGGAGNRALLYGVHEEDEVQVSQMSGGKGRGPKVPDQRWRRRESRSPVRSPRSGRSTGEPDERREGEGTRRSPNMVEAPGIEGKTRTRENTHRNADLAVNVSEALEFFVPFDPVAFRPVPSRSAPSRQP